MGKAFRASFDQTSKELDFDVWYTKVGDIPTKRMTMLPISVVFHKVKQDIDL